MPQCRGFRTSNRFRRGGGDCTGGGGAAAGPGGEDDKAVGEEGEAASGFVLVTACSGTNRHNLVQTSDLSLAEFTCLGRHTTSHGEVGAAPVA